jgi:hypothetical protein
MDFLQKLIANDPCSRIAVWRLLSVIKLQQQQREK